MVVLSFGCGNNLPPKSKPRRTNGRSWVPFRSDEAKFFAQFPTVPKQTVSEDGNDQRYTSIFQKGNALVRVSFDSKADLSVPLEDRFERLRKILKARNLKLTSLKMGNLKALEGIYEVTQNGFDWNYRHRILYANNGLYQIFSTIKRSHTATKEFDRFFNSVKILEK